MPLFKINFYKIILKNFSKNFAQNKNLVIFAPPKSKTYGVTVALRFLVPSVGVRIPVGLQFKVKRSEKSERFFYFQN